MMWPGVADERVMELRGRGIAAAPSVPWRANGPLLASVVFGLTIGTMAAFVGFFHVFLERAAFWFVAIAAIALAEYLMRAHRFYGAGIESALWLGGLFCMIFGIPGEGEPEALLLFALASAVAGVRMRNGLFLALATAFVISYAVTRHEPAVAAIVGIAISCVALLALTRTWQRPSTEAAWIALLVIPPIAGAAGTATGLPPWWAAVYAALAIACVVIGITLRAHAPFIAAFVDGAIAIGILAAHELLPLETEWRLIVGGAIVLAMSAIASRALRDQRRGIVVRPEALSAFDEEIQVLATVAMQPGVEASADQEPGGGSFGGAGATGRF